MNSDLHARASELFVEARGLGVAERAAFLNIRCGGEPELRAEVESLLAHDAGAAAIDSPVAAVQLAQVFAEQVSAESTGSQPRGQSGGSQPESGAAYPHRIGKYEITGILGEGGMGTVYRAMQESPRRTVALKVIRSASRRPALLRRFEREAEALARLQHPGIAQVFEIGQASTEHGPCPYLAMELIEGVPLTEFARACPLTLAEKLGLIAQIADAVQHAHTKGVIHRDLKPGNILVTGASTVTSAGESRDGTGTGPGLSQSRVGPRPKILDFGVARLLDDPEATSVTDPGQLVGTIRYMSPEQVSGDAHAADARSDVYALGLIAYELLTGAPPYQTQSRPLAEVARAIRETEPTPLSRHDRTLAGDPEVIVAKALEKVPERRYSSAAEFADDIRRFLTDEPITARPATLGYQLSKFAKRHRAVVAGAAMGVIALVAVAGISTAAYFTTSRERDRAEAARGEAEVRRIEAERAREETARALEQAKVAQQAAQREADKAVRSLEFLQAMLSSADPNRADTEVRVATVLDRAAEGAEAKFAGHPEAEATVRYTLGTAYQALGKADAALAQLARARALRAGALGPDHADTLTAAIAHAEVLVQSRRPADALLELDALLVIRPESSMDRQVARIQNLRGQALILQSKLSDAEVALRSAIRIAEANAATAAERASYESNLAQVLERLGKLAEAEAASRAAIGTLTQAWGPDHDLTLTARAQLATLLNQLGRGSESIAELEQLVQRRREAFGPRHPSTLTIINNLANAYLGLKRYAESVPLLLESLEGLKTIAPDEDERVLTVENNLASAYLFLGRFTEAEPIYRDVLEKHRRALGPTHQKTLTTTNNLGKVLQKQGRFEESAQVYAELLPLAEDSLPPKHWVLAAFRLSAAQVFVDMKRFAEAEPLLLAAIPVLESSLDKPGKRHDYTILARKTAVAMYEGLDKLDKAEKYRDAPAEGTPPG